MGYPINESIAPVACAKGHVNPSSAAHQSVLSPAVPYISMTFQRSPAGVIPFQPHPRVTVGSASDKPHCLQILVGFPCSPTVQPLQFGDNAVQFPPRSCSSRRPSLDKLLLLLLLLLLFSAPYSAAPSSGSWRPRARPITTTSASTAVALIRHTCGGGGGRRWRRTAAPRCWTSKLLSGGADQWSVGRLDG